VEGSCEHGNGPSGSIKSWEVPELLHNWQLLNKGSVRCCHHGHLRRRQNSQFVDGVRREIVMMIIFENDMVWPCEKS
jgi:hypothetical protein